MDKTQNISIPDFDTKLIFAAAASCLLIFNVTCLAKDTLKMSSLRQKHPYTFLGDRFKGLEKIIGKAPYIGYYTDKNLDDNRSAMQFAQAQLVLTPTILDLNNTSHEFILFDCSSPLVAIKKIKEIGAQPLKANQYGIILARRPNNSVVIKGDAVKTFDKTLQKQRP